MSLPAIFFTLSLFGDWSGTGACYLSHSTRISGLCEYLVHIERTNTELITRNCIMWHQEWGDGWECPVTKYQVDTEGNLWIPGSNDPRSVGTISDNELVIDYKFPGGAVNEHYSLKNDALIYTSTQRTSGMQWDYSVTLKPFEK